MLDYEKQRALWVFLGEFTPFQNQGEQEIWDIDPVEPDAEQKIKQNAIKQYINTVTEELRVSPGKLELFNLLNKYLKADSFLMQEKIQKKTKSEILVSLQNQIEIDFDTDSFEREREEDEAELKKEKEQLELRRSVLSYLDDHRIYFDEEEKIWKDPINLVDFIQK